MGKKPDNWVDETEIDDPDDKKPAGYDDIPAQIADPDATKPEDWDDEDDGEWEPPLIDNPEFKGEFMAKKIENPAYKGEWSPKQVANKDFVKGEQLAAFDASYIGYELWIVNNGTIFDNILVTDDIAYAKAKGEKLVKEAWDKENKPAEEEEEKDEL